MSNSPNPPQESDFPIKKMGQPAYQAITLAGYWRLEQLTQVKAKDLLKLHGVGPKSIEQLRIALAEKGLSFAGE